MQIHHIGIAVENLEVASKPYLMLGYALEAKGIVESQGVQVYMLKSGHSRIELLAPIREGSAVAKFIEKRGAGIHHLALATQDIRAELKRLADEGTPLIDTTARPGFGGHLVAFIHPKWGGGVLIELLEDIH